MKPRVAPPNPEYLKFLSPFETRIRELALTTRELVFVEAPNSTELIYDAYNAVATGYSFTGRPSDAFIHIAIYARWVNLGFNRGSNLMISRECFRVVAAGSVTSGSPIREIWRSPRYERS